MINKDHYDQLETLYPGVKKTDYNFFLFYDLGVCDYGHVVIVNTNFLKKNPDVVKRFMAATHKSWVEGMKNPLSVAETMKRAYPTSYSVQTIKQKMLADYPAMVSPDTEKHGFGYSTLDGWKKTEELLIAGGKLSSPIKNLADVFTNEFLPKR